MADGRARVDALLTRTGVFTYRNRDGSERREYRPDEEVNNPASLASFEAVPVTDDHPPVMLTSKNAREYARGVSMPGIHMDGDHMVGELVIWDDALIAKMDRGKIQVSNGYSCDLEMTPGVSPSGEKYDAIQRNIRGNHVAIVDTGRAGTARVRMDAADLGIELACAADVAHADGEPARCAASPEKSKSMDLETALKALGESNAKLEAETKRADAAVSLASKMEGERDAAIARVDAADKARTDAETAHATALTEAREQGRKDAAERAVIEARAKAAGVEFAAETSNEAIKIAVVKKIDNFDCAGKASAYVDARFDSACERFAAGAAALGAARVTVESSVVNPSTGAAAAVRVDEAEATRQMQSAYADAWKTAAADKGN